MGKNNNVNEVLNNDKIQNNLNEQKDKEKDKTLEIINREMNKNVSKTVKIISPTNSMININNFSVCSKNNEPPKKVKKVKRKKKKPNSIIIKSNDVHSRNNIIPEKNEMEETKNYDDYQLNDMEYLEAIKYDNRSFIQVYWSFLKREHAIIFLFYFYDYNIPVIKFASFLFFISTDMALNVFFYSDETMHKTYLDYGKYDFIQQIEQIIYSTIVSQILQSLICFLSLTDKNIYEIIELKEIKKENLFKILKCIKLKIRGFFLVTIILFIFYWYLITCFCAVYVNTQESFIKDSITSFSLGLVYPFLLYLCPTLLRKISLNSREKRLKILYKLSDIIPFF